MAIDDPSASLIELLEEVDADTDSLHDILGDSRRRYALARLHETVKPMHLDDLAADIAEWERSNPDVEDPGEPETIHQALYHVHVAKMADAGIVEYDGMRDTVTLVDEGHRLCAHLATVADV